MTYNLPIRGDKLTCLVKFQGFGRDTYNSRRKIRSTFPDLSPVACPLISTNRRSGTRCNFEFLKAVEFLELLELPTV